MASSVLRFLVCSLELTKVNATWGETTIWDSGILKVVQSQWDFWTLRRHSLPLLPNMRDGAEMSKYQYSRVLPAMVGTTVHTEGSGSPLLMER